jgi:hypothetical protein
LHAPGEVWKRKNPFDFNWFSKRMYRGMSYVLYTAQGINDRVSILRSGMVNAINFTVYESLRKEIAIWEKERHEIGR